MWRSAVNFCRGTKLARCVMFYLCISKIVNTYTNTECDLMPGCMSENNLVSVQDLANITCHKTAQCQLLESKLSSCQKQFHVALEKFEVKNNWIQMHLVTSVSSRMKGSFLFKISFGHNASCYNFAVDSSFLSNAKESFVLPCIHFMRHQSFNLYVYYKEENNFDLVTFHDVKYTLKDSSDLQVLESGFLNVAPSFNKKYFYLTSNVKEDDTCSFSYEVTICDMQGKPVCKFSSLLKTHHRYLLCPWDKLKPCQKYCIYIFFRDHKQCKYVYPEKNIQITFFKVVPACEDWNAYISATSQEQEVSVLFIATEKFQNCFDSYQLLLYSQKWPECDSNWGRPVSNTTFNHSNEQENITINSVKNGSYCVLVIPCHRGICYTKWARHQPEKVIVKGKTPFLATVDPVLSSKQEFTTYVAITLLLLITGIAIWHIVNKRKKIKMEDYTEDRPLEQVITPLIPTVNYIFHSSDDRDLKKVDTLVEYFRTCADLQVNTLKDVLHEILPKPHRWFPHNILCECKGNGPPCSSNKRFLLLVTDRSLQLVSHPSDRLKMTKAESIFHDYVDYMLSYPNIFSKNHSHVFKVCFEARFINELTGIAGTSWYLLTDRAALIDLCLALGSHKSRDTLEAALDAHPINELF